MTCLIAVAATLALQAGTAAGQSPPVPAVAIGEPAPEFSAVDEHGNRRRLSDYRGSHVILEWTNRDCPFVRKHYDSDNMQSLQDDARARGAVWLTVTSTAPSHPGYMDAGGAERFRNRYRARPTLILLDPDGRMGRQYDVEVTPQIFIIDAAGVLVYMGGMDDKATVRAADVHQATDYVGAALDEALAGKPVSRSITRPYGCPIVY
ncbi:MAG: redoxin domain-containing protein [Gammaproteobacteria bacterium]|nr:redoxin domain-containing protein [Gammaproteobacteria bacterium]NIM73006.1 redoxin domain-containing protein [Gammaproteobacteria bacterium]NIN38622.1 redoxin domain-containing protein [Gammaproteobacteria bacterium]NIO24758.1 redoxin domain-containing protein [Gammaproteobacteria bacterium]NIO65361.1 redoxin domain-containing protein [Gammaproteobacteria bacterium]